MKENLKKQLLIFLLLTLMAALVFGFVLSLVSDIFWVFKVLISVITLGVTFFIFVLMRKLNKSLVYIEKEVIKEPQVEQTKVKKLYCPKCYKPYDGIVCFACGYQKENQTQE